MTATTTFTEAPFYRPVLDRLTIACPHTGAAVDTGYELTAIPELTVQHLLVDCTECGQDHSWRIEDAVVERY